MYVRMWIIFWTKVWNSTLTNFLNFYIFSIFHKFKNWSSFMAFDSNTFCINIIECLLFFDLFYFLVFHHFSNCINICIWIFFRIFFSAYMIIGLLDQNFFFFIPLCFFPLYLFLSNYIFTSVALLFYIFTFDWFIFCIFYLFTVLLLFFHFLFIFLNLLLYYFIISLFFCYFILFFRSKKL